MVSGKVIFLDLKRRGIEHIQEVQENNPEGKKVQYQNPELV